MILRRAGASRQSAHAPRPTSTCSTATEMSADERSAPGREARRLLYEQQNHRDLIRGK
jgi:hypothetical protein